MISRKNIGSACGALFCALFLFSAQLRAQNSVETKTDVHAAGNHNPDDAFYDGVRLVMLGRDKEAENSFLMFLKEKPEVAAAYFELSKISSRDNKADRAEAYIKKAILIDDSNKWYKEQYAGILADENKFFEAASVLATLAKREKNNETYLVTAAMLYQRAGKYDEAISLLDTALKTTGNTEELLLQQEQVYIKKNDLDNAAKVMRRLIAQDPKEPKYYTWLAELYDNNKQPNKSEDILLQAQKLMPEDPMVEYGLAEHYAKANNMAMYRKYIVKALTAKTIDAETQIQYLLPYLNTLGTDTERIIEATGVMAKIVSQHQANAGIRELYGQVLFLNGKRDSALAQYKLAISLDPSKNNYWLTLLSAYLEKSEADSMIAYSEKALRLFPNQASFYFFNGIGYKNKENYDKAIKSITRAIDMQPEDKPDALSQMYAELGDIYNTTKQFELSDTCYVRALELSKDNALFLNNYAYYLSERNVKLDDAERMSKRSLELRPNEATFLDTYGWILYQEKKYSQAKIYIQKAVDKDPLNADPTLWEHLGNVCYKLGDFEKAVEYWKRAKEKGSINPKIEDQIRDKKLYE